MALLQELFGTAKPVIAMAHYPPLPGTPLYDEAGGVDALIEAMRAIMITGYDWGAIGTALLSMAILGVILQTITFWAFHRLAR